MTEPTAQPRYHVLLIGIDDYVGMQPLGGCVNDVDAVAELLCAQAGVPTEQIVALRAPLAGAPGAARDEQRLPTRQRIIQALQDVAAQVKAGERVLIYYSGHGSVVPYPSAQTHFEVLLPVDFKTSGILYDVELNPLLTDIAERGRDLTVILDCCHSAGATRSAGGGEEEEEGADRFADLSRSDVRVPEEVLRARAAEPGLMRPRPRGEAPADAVPPADFSLIAACHADQRSREQKRKGEKRHGVFTAAILDLLRPMGAGVRTVRWGDIWEPLRALVVERSAQQQPWLIGPPERPVLGGPYQSGDLGLGFRAVPEGFRVDAGTLAGLDAGALLAIYPAGEPRIPPRGDPDEVAMRRAVLTVKEARAGSALAIGDGSYEAQPGDRLRLLRPAPAAQLRISIHSSVSPPVRATLEYAVEDEAATIVPAGRQAELIIGQRADGVLWIGDDLCGPGDEEPAQPGPLALVPHAGADAMQRGIRAAIRHYAKYVIPLRLARAGGGGLPEGIVRLRAFDGNDRDRCLAMITDPAPRIEATKNERAWYQVADRARLALQVRNTAEEPMHITLFACDMEGSLQVLHVETIHPLSSTLLWWKGVQGTAYPFYLPKGRRWGVDRLVLLATNQGGLDLRPLAAPQPLDLVVQQAMGGGELRARGGPEDADLLWSASLTYVQVGAP